MIAEEAAEDRVRRDGRNDGAVPGRHLVEPGARDGTAGPGHVLEHDGRAAGNIAWQMPGDGARIDAEAAAEVRPDDEVDGLAVVIIGGANRAGHGGERSERDPAAPESPQFSQHSSAAHQLSSCWRRRIEMASPIEVLDLETLLIICTRNTTEICRPDRRLAVPAWNVEHIGRLAQPREAP